MMQVSSKNNKAEILEAFEEMKKKYEELKITQTQQSLTLRKEEDGLLEKTSVYADESLEGAISSLRQAARVSLDNLSQKLQEENKKLTDIKTATEIANKRLVESRDITLGADAIDAIISLYDQKEKELKTKYNEMEETCATDASQKRKEWEREQEEYEYNLKIERKKEQDSYEADCAKKDSLREEKIAKREEEISEKEKIVAEKVGKITKMEEEISLFPEKLETAIQTAKNQTAENLKKEFEVEKKLAEQEYRAEKNMLEAKISSLLETIKNQTMEIKSLKDSLAESNRHAQNLAGKVIESVSGFNKPTIKQTGEQKE